MKTKDKAKYLLLHELELIIEEMSDAMRKADVDCVAGNRLTPHMDMVLIQYFEWARRAREAGL